MTALERNTPADWHDIQVEAAAQFSALCMQVGAGRYPWQEHVAHADATPSLPKKEPAPTVFAYDLLVV